MANIVQSKFSAFLLTFLMATISMSATMQSWEFSTLEQDISINQVSSNTTVSQVAGSKVTVNTGVLGNAQQGIYETFSDNDDFRFSINGISGNGTVALGQSHTCAIFSDAKLKCWGLNDQGQIGMGLVTGDLFTTPQIIEFDAERFPVAVSSNLDHTCAILDNGDLTCWGMNSNGQLGIGAPQGWQSNSQATPQLVNLGVGKTAKSVSAGSTHTCAILNDDSLKCWGSSGNGHLGTGATTSQYTPQLVNLGPGKTAVSVSAGNAHTCAILNDGTLKCWGDNSYGQLGISSTINQPSPQQVDLGTNRLAVAVNVGSGFHTCAVLDNGDFTCWGMNSNGQLGIGATNDANSPQTVDLGSVQTAVSVSLGFYHTCAILDDGSLKCWGLNNYGQLGYDSSGQPVTVPDLVGLDGDREVYHSFSTYFQTCVTTNYSELICWGNNEQGQLGDDELDYGPQHRTIGFKFPKDSQSVSASGRHICAIVEELYCWGQNNYGQLGIGSTSNQNHPQIVDLGVGNIPSKVSTSSSHTCATTNSGELYCWGQNSYGRLGIGPTSTNSLIPQLVNFPTGRTVVEIFTGYSSTCAILDNGDLMCWGRTWTDLNNPNFYTPQQVDLGQGRTATSAAIGSSHSCVVLDNGDLKCWGIGPNGQLGLGSTTSHGNPQQVYLGSGRTAVSVGAGTSSTCVTLDNGELKCWGYNAYGELGIGSTNTELTPQSVLLGTGSFAVSVSVGSSYACAVLQDGTLKCWGYNGQSRLGLGYGNGQAFSTPQTVIIPGGGSVNSVHAGDEVNTCALVDDTELYCWGEAPYTNYGSTPQNIKIYNQYPYTVLSTVPSNSWFGSTTEPGILELDVWYNVTSSNTFHRVILDIIPSIEYTSSYFSVVKNNPFTINPVNINCNDCIHTLTLSLPTGVEFNSTSGEISGMAGEIAFNNSYMIQSMNSSAITYTQIWFKIIDLPPNLSSTLQSIYYNRGFRNSSIPITNIGGEVTTSSISPSINGMSSFNPTKVESLVLSSHGSCGIIASGLFCSDEYYEFEQENKIVDFSLSENNLCFVVENHTVLCKGGNDWQQISDDSSINIMENLTLLIQDNDAPITQVATSQNTICTLNVFSRIDCNGYQDYSFYAESLVGNPVKFDSGETHFCMNTDLQKLYCWGENTNLAIGTNSDPQNQTTTPQLVSFGSSLDISDFDTGERHTCAVNDDNKILCWGAGENGQIGDGYTINQATPQLVASPAWAKYTKVSAGNSHTCAMLDDNGVMCWGDNSHGQLGDGTTTNRLTPVNVSIIPSWMNVVDVVAGDGGTCVIDDLAAVWCWGDNSNQKLGLNSTISAARTPQPIRFSDSASLMGILPMGVLTGAPLTTQPTTVHRLYGNNSGGSDDVNITITVGLAADYPITHLNLTRNTSVVNVSPVLTGGPYQFSIQPSLPPGMNLGVNNGTIWGTPLDDQVSTIHTITVENNSGWDKVEINITVVDILANISYPSSDYTFVRNWTIDPIYLSNNDGGDLLSVNSDIDLPIGLDLNTSLNTYYSAIALESGGYHSCSILNNGSLKCWGYNLYGQLGIGTSGYTTNQNTPQLVDLGVGRTAVSLGLGIYHTCAILDDGSLKCWGYNLYGQLGIGTSGSTTSQTTPQSVDLGVGRTAVSVSLGNYHTCAILDDGSLKCWGHNNNGQLGIGSNTNQNTPQSVDLGIGRTAVLVSLGTYHTCAILDNGSLKCWGYNLHGQLGIGTSGYTTNQNTPQSVDLGIGRTAISLSLGTYHTCAILDDGNLKCWGQNSNGQLGIGSTTTQTTPQSVDLGIGRTAVSLGLGFSHTCAILDDGSLKCWGQNSNGQLGIGSNTNQNTPQSVDLGVGRTAVSLGLGFFHTCAILDDGSLKCWGQNSNGQLGIGSVIVQTTPVFVEGFGQLIKLGKIYGIPTQTTPTQTYTFYGNNSVGSDTFDMDITVVPAYDYGNNTLVLTRNQTMNSRSPIITGGQYTVAISPPLPQGLNFEPSNGTFWGTPPVNQTTQTYFIDVSNSSGSDTIELTITIDDIAPFMTYDTYNETFVRGFNITTIEANQTGGNVQSVQANPILPSGLYILENENRNFQVSAGDNHNCAIINAPILKCWGQNYYGQLGIGFNTSQYTPQIVDFGVGRTVISVSSGRYHTCATIDDGSLKCWGRNQYGQLGIGSTASYNTPQLVDLGTGRTAVSVSTGYEHTCAILDDGSLKCWGDNYQGQLGIGSTTTQTIPQLVDLGVGRTTVSVSLGKEHTCAVLDDGSLKCWGRNLYGELGVGSSSYQDTPQLVDLGIGRTAISVSLGDHHTCAILNDKSLKCWGDNFRGQLGIGSNSEQSTPQIVNLGIGRTAVSVSLGGEHTCAVLDDRSLKCWGENYAGQLGIGSNFVQTTPQIINLGIGLTAISVSLGDQHTCAVLESGNLKCWGHNTWGQLGDGSNVAINSPPLYELEVFSNYSVGSIIGTPKSKSNWIDYTIWTNNSIGSHSSIISMRVVPAYDYGNNTVNLVRNETMSTRSPIITGGPYTTVSIQPSLPVGLFFEPTNGSIWGTPIFDQAGTDYTITVSNQYGSDSSIISIAISEIPPILEYDVSYMSYRRGFLSDHPIVNLTGGAVAGFEISPALPAGLHFNTSSGIISGVPTTTHSLATHTIWANNSFGSSSWDINFEVLPGIDNSYNSIYLTRNVTMPAYSPTINIDQITLSIQPHLPDGLTFDYQTGIISGTPLIPWTNTFYSIRLSNSTGEDWLNFTLEVDEILPNIYYPSSNLNLYNGFGFEPLSPIGDAGYPENWAWNGSSVSGIHVSMYNSTDTISSSGSTICTITADYQVVCWGANDMGQLGQGNTNSINNMVNVTLTTSNHPVDIAVGKHHTCVVTSAGEIECWGQNDFGQLGRGFSCAYGSYSNGCNGNFAVTSPDKIQFNGQYGFVEVSVGDTHTCGLLENGTAMCWGSNSDGQLGDGTNSDSSIPVYVSSSHSIYFTQIDLGKAHSCATNYSGEIYCWGRNSFGQLGDGTIQNRLTPVMVNLPIGYSAVSVSSGGDHSCAILNGSQPSCWGRNSQGQLGDGTVLGKLEPRIIQNSAWLGVSRITAGETQSCVITLTNEVWCWGESSSGMFSSSNSIITIPVQVNNINSIGASLVMVGENHLCISTIRWSVMCSGDNQENQIPWDSNPVVTEFSEYLGLMVHVDRSIAGTIYGAPHNGLGSITLEMAITNVAGTQYVQNSIIIDDSYSYSLTFIEAIRNQTLSPINPTLSGLSNAEFSISPSLANGISIDAQTGEISGKPIVNSSESAYVITFANKYGEVSTNISMVIYEPAANIVYPVSDIIITRADQFIQYSPTVSNGFVSQWSISPSLPTGLSFSNGLISGQAQFNQSNTTYRVYGNNSGGVSFVDLTITILEPIPEFTPLQAEYIIQRGDTLSDIVVGNIGGHIAVWNISPQLPSGLEFVNGRILGTPTVNISSLVYTIRGENTGGYDEISFTIQVLEPAPMISGQSSSITGIRDVEIDEILISNTGGMAENWTILPDLPNGLIFENGLIYGTPLVNSTSELFTITAVSDGGNSQFTFYLEILEPGPIFNIAISDYILYKDSPFEAIKTSSSGGNIASYSITPTLPSGMFFDENRGMIQGVPLVISPEIQYTITAENSGGTYQQVISIRILNQAPVFTLPYEIISLTEQVEMAKFAPFISSNIVVDSWSLEFEQGIQLPEGLVFDSTSGSIFGRPTSVISEINVTINASNDGGFYSLSFRMKVLSDYDGDTIPDELDEDDDNDGYSDKEEELKDSDPYDEDSNPVEGFEIIIPNTEISLGAWDIIGMLTGIPLIIFLTFSLLTRNKRARGFQDDIETAKSRKEISEVAERYEKALMLRLIGPHHGMRLERIRAETDDKLEEAERRFKYKLEEDQEQVEEKAEVEKAQFYDKVDQTPLVEQSEELVEEQSDEVGLGPQIDTEPTQVDDNGRQWYYDQEERYWWRDNFEAEWQLLEPDQAAAKIREEELKENKS